MLSKFPDHPEVKWEEREPVVNAPTLDVKTDSEGEEENCAANTLFFFEHWDETME